MSNISFEAVFFTASDNGQKINIILEIQHDSWDGSFPRIDLNKYEYT